MLYLNILKIDALKRSMEIIDRHIERLSGFDSVTVSGARKRLAIPKLQSRKSELEKEFSEISALIMEELKSLPSIYSLEADLIQLHYLDISKAPSDLQKDLDFSGMAMEAKNFRAKLQTIWIKQISN